ncbi:MAG: hypothetical protein DRI48_10465 [Chloroflexi bacterium]|nr:MAG: hypothetical protein DRI48_10465 [Chloroflexota bacterium]
MDGNSSSQADTGLTSRSLEVATLPKPSEGVSPAMLAARLSTWASDQVDRDHRKCIGQFFTPLSVAKFMALLVDVHPEVRILDPGCGTAVLTCALIERLAASKVCRKIQVVGYDVDKRMVELARLALEETSKFCSSRNVALEFDIREDDFVNATGTRLAFQSGPEDITTEPFDVITCNPPYVKLRNGDPRAVIAKNVGAGVSNTYALFMMLSAYLLKPGGQMVFITPRSFCSGHYFARFRREFFRMVQPAHIHVFDSRTETFASDNVLQESVILKTVKTHRDPAVNYLASVSSSVGMRDLEKSRFRKISLDKILDTTSPIRPLRLPTSHGDERVLDYVDSWPRRLGSLGLRVSTGPVVPFRAKQHLSSLSAYSSGKAVPLLWSHHVGPMRITWPSKKTGRKPEAIAVCEGSRELLVPLATCVLVRRFSPKEWPSRIVASVLSPIQFPSLTHIGLENHLNYIYRIGVEMSTDEACGLALILNSPILNRYFRILNGNTQVSATELRSLPLPSLDTIKRLGKLWLKRSTEWNNTAANDLICEVIAPPKELIDIEETRGNGKS